MHGRLVVVVDGGGGESCTANCKLRRVTAVLSGLVRRRMLWAAGREGKGVEWMELAMPSPGVERHGFNAAAISASII